MLLAFLIVAIFVLVLALGAVAWISVWRRRIRSLRWPVSTSLRSFERKCEFYLRDNGWRVGTFGTGNLLGRKENCACKIFTHGGGWKPKPSLLRDIRRKNLTSKLVVIVDELPPPSLLDLTEKLKIVVIHFRNLQMLEQAIKAMPRYKVTVLGSNKRRQADAAAVEPHPDQVPTTTQGTAVEANAPLPNVDGREPNVVARE